MIAVRAIAAMALGYYVWRVTQQRGERMTDKLQQAAQEIITGTLPAIPPIAAPAPRVAPRAFDVRALLDLIARAEANRGYDSYYNRSRFAPARPVSQMTLAEVRDWQNRNRAAGARSTAVGRYQFIAATLQSLISQSRTPLSAIFTSELQDAFALRLLQRRGLDSFRAGILAAEQFAFEIAKEWAGLPRDNSGRSYYSGVAGNRANVAWADVINVLRG